MKKSVVAGALVALIGAGVGIPYVTGMQAERTLRDNLRSLSEHPRVSHRMVSYERGWFGAEAVSKLTLNSANRKLAMRLHHKVHHGPTLLLPALARITTVPDFQGEPAKLVARYFGDKAPITAHLDIALTGTRHLTLSSPPFERQAKGQSASRIKWAGFSAKGTLGDGKGGFLLEVPELELSGGNRHLRLEEASLRSQLRRGDEGLWLANSDLSAKHLEANLPGLGPDGTQRLALTAPTFSQQMGKSEQKDFLVLTNELTAEQGELYGRKLQSPQLAMELRHLDRSAYRKILRHLGELHPGDLVTPKGLLQEGRSIARGALPGALASSPEIAVTELTFDTPKGSFQGKAKARYTGNEKEARSALSNLRPLLQGLDAEAKIKAGKPLMIGFLEDLTRAELQGRISRDTEPIRMERMVESSVRQRVGMMEAMGILRTEEDRYVTKVALNQGALSINGQLFHLRGGTGRR